MNSTLDKPRLWSYREAAELFGLSRDHGYRTISDIVTAHEIPTRKMASALGIDRAGLKTIARALNKNLNET